jgi:hypothetical protein
VGLERTKPRGKYVEQISLAPGLASAAFGIAIRELASGEIFLAAISDDANQPESFSALPYSDPDNLDCKSLYVDFHEQLDQRCAQIEASHRT